MIGFLKGTNTLLLNGQHLISTDTVGWSVMTPTTAAYLAPTLTLYISPLWNQEQGLQLYGFITQTEQAVFHLLCECSGVGPKLALNALSQQSPTALCQALSLGQISILSALQGIGAKRAQTMIVTLSDKATKLYQQLQERGMATENSSIATVLLEVSQALEGLGYQKHDVQKVITTLAQQSDSITPNSAPLFTDLLKKGLSLLR